MPNNIVENTSSQTSEQTNIISQLYNGKLPLAKMFFKYNLPAFLLACCFSPTVIYIAARSIVDASRSRGDLKLYIYILFTNAFVCIYGYFYIVFIGQWQAANAYSGPKKWAIAAKIVICCQIALSIWPLWDLLQLVWAFRH